jgi:hypothetical protein
MFWIGKLAFIRAHRPSFDPPPPADWPSRSKAGSTSTSALAASTCPCANTSTLSRTAGQISRGMCSEWSRSIGWTSRSTRSPTSFRGHFKTKGSTPRPIVMLGGVGAGTAQAAGFWARFVMAEAIGVWAIGVHPCPDRLLGALQRHAHAGLTVEGPNTHTSPTAEPTTTSKNCSGRRCVGISLDDAVLARRREGDEPRTCAASSGRSRGTSRGLDR